LPIDRRAETRKYFRFAVRYSTSRLISRSLLAEIDHRHVRMDEVVALEQERLSRQYRERVREAIAII
jgi:hypothetical protein